MGLSALKPQPGEGGNVALGCLSSVVLHVAATIAIVIFGSVKGGQQGALIVLPFWAFIGLAQWIYIGPVAWAARRFGSAGVAKGLLLAGAGGTLLTALCWGGMGLMSLQNAEQVRDIQQREREHPTDYISTDGVVTVVDDKHFEFKREDTGDVVSLQTWPGLDYIFLKKDGGYEQRTREMLKPGVRVSVEYSQERGKPPVSPSIVRVYEEGAKRP